MFGLTALLRAVFKALTSAASGIEEYADAFAKTGKVANQAADAYLEESSLEHARKMAALRAKVTAEADPIDIN